MVYEHTQRELTDEDRRDFLKALGIGSVVAGSVTLNEVRTALTGTSAPTELVSIGQGVRSDLAGELDAELLASQEAAFAEHAADLSGVVGRGFPEREPREEFANVAAAANPIYEHFIETGFFESTSTHLPTFTPEFLTESAQSFIGSEALADPLEELGITDQVGVDLVLPMVNRAEELSHYHWIATEGVGADIGDAVPPITQRATGGVLLWLEDLDTYLWQKQILLTDETLADATWDAQAMAAGFHLLTEGARHVADGSDSLSDGELGALFSVGIALQTIAQEMLAQDAYWITEEMRDPGNVELELVGHSR